MDNSYKTRVTLLEKVRDLQDEQAWTEFLDLYKTYIYAVIRSMKITPHDADDILQQITLILWKTLQDYKYDPSKGKFRNWIAIVTRNEVKRFIKKRKRQLVIVEDALQQGALDYLDDIRIADIEQIANEEWELFTARIALNKMKKQFSESVYAVFEMHIKGASPSEVSEALNIPRQTVYKYISRIKVCFIEELHSIRGC